MRPDSGQEVNPADKEFFTRVESIARSEKYKGYRAQEIREHLQKNPQHLLFAEFIFAGLEEGVNPQGILGLASAADKYSSYSRSIVDALNMTMEDKEELAFALRLDVTQVEYSNQFYLWVLTNVETQYKKAKLPVPPEFKLKERGSSTHLQTTTNVTAMLCSGYGAS